VPRISTWDSEKNAEYENALPLPRWQSTQEQAWIICGATLAVIVSWPQGQPAVFGYKAEFFSAIGGA
jgi:hypothetical protein